MPRFRNLRKSLSAQLGVLAVTFVIFAALQFVLGVYWQSADSAVANAERRILQEITSEVAGNVTPLDQIAAIDSVRRASEQNPNFGYILISGVNTVRYGAVGPEIRFPDLWEHVRRMPLPAPPDDDTKYRCLYGASYSIPFTAGGVAGQVYAGNCPDSAFYIEIVGVEASPFSNVDMFAYWAAQIPFENYRGYFVVGFGVLVIALLMIYRAVNSLRTVARVARSIDLDRKGATLSEAGLPLEVQPIVSALNDMFRRIEDYREKQRFFVAAAAHELRTPLTVLRTRLEDFPESDERSGAVNDIRDMSRLVEQLLRLTQVRSAEDVKFKTLRLVDVAHKVCASRAPLAVERGIDVELLRNDAGVVVEGDEEMIFTAVANLLDNAISVSKANDTITVEATPGAQISVRDQGPGIRSGTECEIFEPFAKIPPNRKGHGLGLAIVQAVMAFHQGSARAWNARGGGAVFELSFHPSVQAARSDDQNCNDRGKEMRLAEGAHAPAKTSHHPAE